MYTLAQLKNQVKRRFRQLRSTTDVATETEVGNIASDSAIQDAINRGRKQLMLDVENAKLWGSALWVLATSANTEIYKIGKDDEHVLSIDSVWYDVTSDGLYQTSTAEAHKLRNAQHEEFIREDPMDEPSITNPKYRFVNAGLKIMVSVDGTVVAGKYIRVEGIRELSDLTADSGDSNVSDTLDALCVDYAIHIICQHVLPELSQAALRSYYMNVNIMNKRGF
jgi:hypothetical protein